MSSSNVLATTAPDKAGWLKKQGGTFKAYKKRHFELRSGALYYYKNPGDKPQGVIPLNGCKVGVDDKHKYGFTIAGPFPRVYYILADTEEERSSWMKSINEAIGELSDSPTSLQHVEEEEKEETIVSISDSKVSLKDFELLKVIGRGSFGKVMQVKHKETGKVYAMKVLRKDVIIRENMVAHTKSEKEILQKIKHPFIVQLCFAFQTPEKLYLILEYLSGGELFYHLKQEGRFGEERAKLYTAEIAMAIDYIHRNDIVYRDLKPENVVLDKQGHIGLTDFGLAKTSMGGSHTYTFCGTPEYLAPEILTGQGHGKSVDWWSLGVLLYEMLTGLPPFYSENINEMYELILRGPLRFPDYVSNEAQDLLSGLLDRDPDKRLGGGPRDGQDVMDHPFFSNLNWEELYNRKIDPPFVPSLEESESAALFDPEFTTERAIDSIAEVNAPNETEDFRGFTYQSESVLEK